MKTLEEIKRSLPKDELRDDAIGIFKNTDEKAVTKNLTDPNIAVAAFRTVFFDIADAQTVELKF